MTTLPPRNLSHSELDTTARTLALIAAGWTRAMAEALAENGYTVASAIHLDTRTAFGLFLEREGMIGYTSTIIAALSNCEEKLGKARP